MKKPYALANESKDKYLEVFKELYEHSPWVIQNVYEIVKSDKKFDDIEKFHALLCEEMLAANDFLRMNLIKAHPMLAGKEAQKGELTDFSTNEQKSAGLNSCTKEEIELFNKLNRNYFEKFNFPYILAVKGKNKEEIIEDFNTRLENSYEKEKQIALEQINKIALIRIKGIYGN